MGHNVLALVEKLPTEKPVNTYSKATFSTEAGDKLKYDIWISEERADRLRSLSISRILNTPLIDGSNRDANL